MEEDLNPDFKFDVGDTGFQVQTPWDFSGALAEAQAERDASKQTTLDRKIELRLLSAGAKLEAREAQKGSAGVSRDRVEFSEADSSSEEDNPLPGEVDEDSSIDTSVQFSDEEATGTQDHLSVEIKEMDDDTGDSEQEHENENNIIAEHEEEEMHGEHADAEEDGALEERRHSGKGAESSSGIGKFFAEMPNGTRFSAQNFSDLNLSRPLIKACTTLGYLHPTPIQAACVPLALMGRDISGSAMTGSGKTAAFALPLLERLLFRSRRIAATYALILTPTRELAVQVHSMTQKLAQFTDVRVALVVGGLSLQVQASTLRSNPEIIVATPGRLIDHLRNTQSVGIEDLQALVLDEADRLLEMGFSEEIKEILRLAPRKRQTMLFSATMTEEVQKLASLSLQNPVRLAADLKSTAPSELTQEVIRIKEKDAGMKEALLLALCARAFQAGRTIVFFRTKKRAHRAKMLFGLAGLSLAAELHGDMTQASRLDSLERFRKGEAAFLLATDVAARGLDILGVEVVINYDAPPTLASYIHRIGRTARAGNVGKSVTLVEDADRKLIKEVVKQSRAHIQQRVVPQAAIKHWAARIGRLAPDIERLVEEEREERDLRRAEMEAIKAENMLQHEDEIFARPPRTWFQTTKQKQALVSAEQHDREPATKKSPRDKQAEKNARKRARAQDALEQADGKKKHKLMQETEASSKNIRAIKAREAELRQQGMHAVQAGRAAAAAITGRSSSSAQKTKAVRGGDKSLVEGSGLGKKNKFGTSSVYSGGSKSGKISQPGGSGLSKQEKNKMKRHGKGSKAFKSKARHKRR